jgi:hypothetical protein
VGPERQFLDIVYHAVLVKTGELIAVCCLFAT